MVSIISSTFNFMHIPVTYWLVAPLFVASLLYLLKRCFGKAKVNCWFCNTNCYVKFHLRNQWFCPNCHQYNGFTASGDYNSSIPNMHHEHLNSPNVGRPVSASAGTLIDQPINLCAKCSRNQLLKVKQMSQFEPIREENFQQEAKIYEKKLDKLYSLCKGCQDATNRHIKMQDTIIRGSMLSRKRLNMKQAMESTSTTANTIKRLSNTHWSIHVSVWGLVFVSSVLHALNSISISLNSVINPLASFITSNSAASTDIFSTISLAGFACSIMGILTNNAFYFVNVCCAALWFVHCFLVPWFNILDAIQSTLSPSTMFIQAATESMKSPVSDAQKGSAIHLQVILVLYFSSIFALIVLSSICLYKSARKDVTVAKRVSPSTNRFAKIATRDQHRKTSAELDEELYSDCSMPSEDEASTPVPKRQHFNNNGSGSMDPGLNGSLLALNLKDGQQSKQNKQPFSNGAFTSALHTPPPSRSSSLLSLSSHHSGHNYFTASNFNQPSMSNQLEFAKPYDNIPFSRYKSYTTVSGGQTNKRALDTKSTISYPVAGWKNSHDIRKPLERPHSSKQNSRPLISPAKLNWRRASQRKRTFNASEIFKESPYKSGNSNWEQKSNLDISFHDSISQTGETFRPELSDDEDHPMFQTPHRRRSDIQNDVDMNSSSPKSVISNLSCVTMKSIEEVENSRICKWLMFGCLLLNLVLIVLLIWDVKEIRESQNWKANSKL
uniref:Uncharacterized protein LOC104266800 n=1 Tax=Phallusia mammillata TaxID=59560 RepID=A0A6F9DIJ3_9ASCI|nr:uncharacterized protein LOC104266800 [Phallusia mammillata]